MRWMALTWMMMLAGCVTVVGPARQQPAPQQPAPAARAAPAAAETPTPAQERQFVAIVRSVEPVAERECRARTQGTNCDFRILVDDRPGRPPNAFQTLDKTGRPILAFNLALIAQAANADELAFVMAHEAAHHIAGHISRQQQNSAAGALILGGLTALTGAGSGAVDSAADLGASVGARSYSKNYELEADALGTVIAHAAGYDPVRGAEFFNRIPDPGNRFLGTHPPNAQRINTVRRVAAGL